MEKSPYFLQNTRLTLEGNNELLHKMDWPLLLRPSKSPLHERTPLLSDSSVNANAKGAVFRTIGGFMRRSSLALKRHHLYMAARVALKMLVILHLLLLIFVDTSLGMLLALQNEHLTTRVFRCVQHYPQSYLCPSKWSFL